MEAINGHIRRNAARWVGILAVVVCYGFTRLPSMPGSERARLPERFQFTKVALPTLPGAQHTIRQVHPSLQRIAAWISSVGAAVALCDLDGDGLPNDVCCVDTRIDQVIATPVPGTGDRFATFAFDPGPLPYERATMAPMGCVPGDFNEDGATDILVYFWGRTPVVYLQRRDLAQAVRPLGAADWQPVDIVPGGQRWFTNAATQADLDGDGHNDIIIGNYFADGAHILDANADGSEHMQHSMSRACNGGRDRILKWVSATQGVDPTVAFEEVPDVLDEQMACGWSLAVGAADLDGDLLPEIYFAHDFGPDRLLHNRSNNGTMKFALLSGERTLTTPRSKVLGGDSFKGMGVDFADLNRDGQLDIFVTNIATEYALEESHLAFLSGGDPARMRDGIAPYVDRSEELGLSRSGWIWDVKLGDFDLDGTDEVLHASGFVKGGANRWPELHELAMGNDELLANPASWPRFEAGDDLSGHQHNPFFVRSESGRYYDVAAEIGLGDPFVTRGIATADVDADGDLDYALGNQWETSYVIRNDASTSHRFLGLHVLVPLQAGIVTKTRHRRGHNGADTPGRPAIGATVSIHMPGGQIRVAQIDGGNGHSGVRSPDLHFGLGNMSAEQLLEVEIRWRDGDGQIHHDTIRLRPGWHTVLLAWPNREETVPS